MVVYALFNSRWFSGSFWYYTVSIVVDESFQDERVGALHLLLAWTQERTIRLGTRDFWVMRSRTEQLRTNDRQEVTLSSPVVIVSRRCRLPSNLRTSIPNVDSFLTSIL